MIPETARGMKAECGDKCSVGNLKNRWRSRRLRPRPLPTIPYVSFPAYTLVHLLVSLSASSRAFVYSPLPRCLSSRQLSWPGRLRQPSALFQQLSTRGEDSGLYGGGKGDDGSGFSWDAIADNRREDPAPMLSITTFNVLAPIFKRVGTSRESNFRDAYLERNLRILRHLNERGASKKSVRSPRHRHREHYCPKCHRQTADDRGGNLHYLWNEIGIQFSFLDLGSDVICLQELWVAKPEIVDMYRRCLEGYRMYTLPRTGSRDDGLACFVKHGIDVLDRQDIRLKGMGGRVALILHLGIPAGGDRPRREMVVANTHLLFPHARTFSILRIREVKKLLAFMECYTQAHDLARLPVVLCGDFNGMSSGRVYKHLTERGFRCSYEDALGPGTDRSGWITHANHRGEEVGVDYVWYRNPNPRQEPMEPDWESIVYQSTKQILLKTFPDNAYPVSNPEERETWPPGGDRKADDAAGDRTYDETDKLSTACKLLGLSEGFELDEEELQLLLDSSADDFDFLVPTILDGSSTGLEGAAGGLLSLTTIGESRSRLAGSCTLETVSSQIWPPALEQGVWPSDYNVSDHGSLTTFFRVAAPAAEIVSPARDLVFGSPPLELSTAVHEEASAAGNNRNRTESRDFGGGDDGFYGFR